MVSTTNISLAMSVIALVVAGAGIAYLSNAISPVTADVKRLSTDVSDTKSKLGAISQEQTTIRSALEKEVSGLKDALKKAESEIQKATAREKIIEAARTEKTLVVYGPMDAPDVTGIIWPRFKQQYPWAELQYTEGFGPLMARFVQESKSGVPTADVVTQSLASLLLEPIGKGETVPFPDNRYKDLYPKEVLDPQGRYYIIFGLSCVAGYNTNKVKAADLPKTWMDMIDPKWKGRIVFNNPPSLVAFGQCLAEMSAHMDAATYDRFLKGLAANNPRITESATHAYQTIVSGEKDIGIVYLNDIIVQPPGTPVKHVWLNPTPFTPIGIVIAKNAKHPNLARLFLEWMTSAEGQAAIGATGRVPILAGVPSPVDKVGGIPPGITLVSKNAELYTNPAKYTSLFKQVFGIP